MIMPPGSKMHLIIASTLRIIRQYVLPILFPRHCPFCNQLLPYPEILCKSCQARLPLISQPTCFRCGKPLGDMHQELCYDCRIFPKSFDQGLALFLYNSMTRSSIVAFKYHNQRYLSDFYVEGICRIHLRQLKKWHLQAIIPIPIHKNKRKKRGYNQAGLIANQLAMRLNLPCYTDLVLRNQDTLPQKQFSPQARLNNLKKAFGLNPRYTDGQSHLSIPGLKRILLVDDIYTTGATMESCTRLLKSAGVEKVYVYSLCIGVSRD